MRLNIKGRLPLIAAVLSLIPVGIVGVVAYESARIALEDRIRFNLETLAGQTVEKLDRLLEDRQRNLQTWAQLGFIEDDTVTADADGRILQFLQEAKRNLEFYQELWVAGPDGKVISSTLPAARGQQMKVRPWMAAGQGEIWVEPPGLVELTGRVGMVLAVPIKASFDPTKTVGVLVAALNWALVVELLHAVPVLPEGQNEQGYLVLVDTQGMLLSYPRFLGPWEVGKTTAASVGLEALPMLREAESGGRSESVAVRGSTYLVGHATTGKRAYVPGAWRVALLMRTDVAFAPLRRLMWTLLGLFVLLGAGAASVAVFWANQYSISVKLRELIQQIQQAGLQITTASSQILRTAEEAATGSVQQAASIAEVTATMEELTSTAKQIANNATAVEKIAEESAHAAHTGDRAVGEALAAMDKIRRRVEEIAGKTLVLGEHSQRIAEVLNLIKEIAREIHLLAVNAAIESVAAGEHGKRFSVVASEVRRLAEKTRESAEEIKQIVGEIQTATNMSVLATEQGVKEVEGGVALATRARGTLEEILQMVDRTTQAIRQITLATQQQRSASEQIVQTMREVADVTRESAAGMQQSASSVAELARLADQLKAQIGDSRGP